MQEMRRAQAAGFLMFSCFAFENRKARINSLSGAKNFAEKLPPTFRFFIKSSINS